MNKKPVIRRISSLMLALCMIAAMISAFCLTSDAAPALPPYNTEARHVVCTSLSTAAEDYYTGNYTYEKLSKLKGASNASTSTGAASNNPLYTALSELMTATHSFKTSYSGTASGSLAYYWQRTDAVEGSSTFTLFYSDTTVGASNFNREHVWPKSKASFNQSEGGSDLHHLRPENPTMNSTRGNLVFGNVKGVYSNATVGNNYYKTSSIFECKDDVKGDVARILLYVYVRWGELNLYSGNSVIESLDTLLEWCALDPVDTWEMRRNDLIQMVQGNRNVFIDYPELAWQMFGKTLPADMTTPTSGSCTHNYVLNNQTEPTCTDAGTILYTCTECGKSYSETIKALGHIDENDDGVCERCGKYFGIISHFVNIPNLADEMHVVIYHPEQEEVLTVSPSGTGLAGAKATLSGDELDLPENAAVFLVRMTDDGKQFYLINDQRYLTSGPTGNKLYFEDQPNEYSLWRTEEAGNGEKYIINVNARYNGTSLQALEYYRGAYTTYGFKETSIFEYAFYGVNGHVWGPGTVVQLPSGETVKTHTCTLCGMIKEEQPPKVFIDINGDGIMNISDATAMLDMLSGLVAKTYDANGDGIMNIADVTYFLNALSLK